MSGAAGANPRSASIIVISTDGLIIRARHQTSLDYCRQAGRQADRQTDTQENRNSLSQVPDAETVWLICSPVATFTPS